ncbi:hypothetical protein BURCENBC7_AP4667 [Burkholderia cenocepacia BC7]|nr:hypothetical protein BURCENK562V_C0585 [Burkholderia cenocepacia K56-2Valvano]ERI31098.1 hypothetical protein BURCENBC7_AP4667 [Burkholderia cenocepacia BC7]
MRSSFVMRDLSPRYCGGTWRVSGPSRTIALQYARVRRNAAGRIVTMRICVESYRFL